MATELRDEESESGMESHSFSSEEEEDDKDFPIIMILFAGLWTCLFAVFALGFDMDPDSCVVSNKYDLIAARIPFVDKEDPEDPSTIDVAVRFRFFFNMAFFMSCTQLVLGIVGLFMQAKDTVYRRLIVLLL